VSETDQDRSRKEMLEDFEDIVEQEKNLAINHLVLANPDLTEEQIEEEMGSHDTATVEVDMPTLSTILHVFEMNVKAADEPGQTLIACHGFSQLMESLTEDELTTLTEQVDEHHPLEQEEDQENGGMYR